MIDFSVLKNLFIPEGSVQKITDKIGTVLWSAVEKVTLNITATGTSDSAVVWTNGLYNSNGQYGSLEGTDVNGNIVYTNGGSVTLQLPIGTELFFYLTDAYSDSGYGDGVHHSTLSINGLSVDVDVLRDDGGGSRLSSFILMSNTSIRLSDASCTHTLITGSTKTGSHGIIEINEAGLESFLISSDVYSGVAGMTWQQWCNSEFNKKGENLYCDMERGVVVWKNAVGTEYWVGYESVSGTIVYIRPTDSVTLKTKYVLE